MFVVHSRGKIVNPKPGSPQMQALVVDVAKATGADERLCQYRLPTLSKLAWLYDNDRAALNEILARHEVVFAPEVIGYARYFQIEYIVREGEDDVPNEVREQFPDAVAIRVIPDEGGQNAS